ncbi:hypothetical protein BI350_14395 [Sporosarcina ureilytica]|uniref:Uncharacterized protein n=2 Tax=Sporosarcina ureilytica TaxID=298596 RepID=A0A1D8JIS1_9BACL|nr:hypothetical protein BI350_14395 [Sporosarcina ureilytica]
MSFVFLLVGCQKEDDNQFRIQVFSNVPAIAFEELEAHTNYNDVNLIDFKIDRYPPVAERLLVEIVSHSGDLIIMDRAILGTAYDSEELHSLDSLMTEENAVELTDIELELFTTDAEIDKVENEEIILKNALRVINSDEFIIDSEPIELVAVIPKYTKSKEMAFSILEELVRK